MYAGFRVPNSTEVCAVPLSVAQQQQGTSTTPRHAEARRGHGSCIPEKEATGKATP